MSNMIWCFTIHIGGIAIEKKQINYLDVITDHYYHLKGSITIEELQAIFSSIYPNTRIKLNKEDWATCNLYVENNDSKKICDYFETVNNRIDISKTDSLQTSEIFINKLLNALQPYHDELYGTIEPFADQNAQGLMICLYNKVFDNSFFIWAYEKEQENNLVVITAKNKTKENLFLSDDYDNAQVFQKDHFTEAISSTLSQLDLFLGKELNRIL